MHPKNFSERIYFLRRRVKQNSFGETISSFEEIGKGWAKVSFKTFDKGTDNKPDDVVYQVTFNASDITFHRIKWRGKMYNLKTGVIFDEINNVASVLIKPAEYQ